ncbi:MAG TPA: transposase [Pyrinomonadaceae bacterium]
MSSSSGRSVSATSVVVRKFLQHYRYRWVVERMGAWLCRYRRLKVRYERRDDIHQAFLDLGCALICWNILQQRF